MHWTNDPINILGVTIDHDVAKMINTNYVGLIQRSHDIIDAWKCRTLSLLGKTMMINSLVGSLYVYRMNVLPLMSNELIDKFNEKIQNYMWNDGVPRVALHILQSPKNQRGLRLVDIKSKDHAFKMQWVQAYQNLTKSKPWPTISFQKELMS